MFINILLFLVGFILLIKGGDWFVDGSCGIAKKFHIPEIIIGATIVSIGTTLPEVMVSATSAVTGHGEMAYGNAIGSIICNTSLICAITLAFRPGVVNKKSLYLPLIFFVIAGLIYAFSAYVLGYFYRPVGIILLLGFVAYIIIQIILLKKNKEEEKDEELKAIDLLNYLHINNNSTYQNIEKDLGADLKDVKKISRYLFKKGILSINEGVVSIVKDFDESVKILNNPELVKKESIKKTIFDVVFLIIGAACIALGAKLLVDNGSALAREFGVSETVISITMVALGTSLPEFVTAITSLIKGHSNLSIGNIIGANLFNLLIVSGAAVTLSPFAVPADNFLFGINSSLILDIPLMFIVMSLLCIPPLIKGKVYRFQGIILLIIYVAFIVLQFVM